MAGTGTVRLAANLSHDPELWAIIGVGVAELTARATVVASHFSLHRDMADLREWMAKQQGAMVSPLLPKPRALLHATMAIPTMAQETRTTPAIAVCCPQVDKSDNVR